MKRSLMLILAFSFVSAAQTMVGLPANGVTLTGNEAAPLLTNQSPKAIFAVVIRSEGTETGAGVNTVWFNFFPVQPNDLPRPLLPNIVTNSGPGPGIVTRMCVDSIVFADGSFSGPDKSDMYPVLEREIAAFVTTGKELLNASDRSVAWAQIKAQAQVKPTIPNPNIPIKEATGERIALRGAARSLMSARRGRDGDNAAMALAAKFVALGNLHKEN